MTYITINGIVYCLLALILLPLSGCFHPRFSVYGEHGVEYVAPSKDLAIEFCLEHEPHCHYTKTIEVHR